MPDTTNLDLEAIPEELRVPVLVLVHAGHDFVESVEGRPEILDQPGMDLLRKLYEHASACLTSLEKLPASHQSRAYWRTVAYWVR